MHQTRVVLVAAGRTRTGLQIVGYLTTKFGGKVRSTPNEYDALQLFAAKFPPILPLNYVALCCSNGISGVRNSCLPIGWITVIGLTFADVQELNPFDPFVRLTHPGPN